MVEFKKYLLARRKPDSIFQSPTERGGGIAPDPRIDDPWRSPRHLGGIELLQPFDRLRRVFRRALFEQLGEQHGVGEPERPVARECHRSILVRPRQKHFGGGLLAHRTGWQRLRGGKGGGGIARGPAVVTEHASLIKKLRIIPS